MTSRTRRTRVVLAGLMAAVALGASGPVSASTPDEVLKVSLRAGAAIQSRGAGAVVTVKVRCAAEATGHVGLQMTQTHADGRLTSSSGGGVPFTCVGAAQDVRVPLIAVDPQTTLELVAPFEPGPAFVSVNLSSCTDTCSGVTDARTVDLHNRRINQPEIVDPTASLVLPAEASFESGGAGVVVSVPYTCAAGFYGSFDASLAQLVEPGAVANAFDVLAVRCTGTQRDGLLTYHAELRPWVAGPAFLTLRGQGCAGADCVEAAAFRTLRVA